MFSHLTFRPMVVIVISNKEIQTILQTFQDFSSFSIRCRNTSFSFRIYLSSISEQYSPFPHLGPYIHSSYKSLEHLLC